jgi:hypothetical protein
MRSASPGSHRTPLQPRRHHPRRLQPARSYWIAPPPAALAASGVLRTAGLIALAPAATSRPSVRWRGAQRRGQRSTSCGARAVRACLTGNRTRRFPGAMRPARRDRHNDCDRSYSIERWRRSHETDPDAGTGLAMGWPDAAARSVVHRGRACPWPSTAHPRLAHPDARRMNHSLAAEDG